MPNDDLIARLSELEAKATPGPLQQNGSHFYGPDPVRRLIFRLCYEGDEQDDANGELLKELRNASPALIDVVRAARELPNLDATCHCEECQRKREALRSALKKLEERS